MLKNAKYGLIKRLALSVLCICIAFGATSIYANDETIDGTSEVSETITLYGKYAVTSENAARVLNSVQSSADSSKQYEYIQISKVRNIGEGEKISAAFEFYAESEGIYDFSGILSAYNSQWYSEYSISVNNSEPVDAANMIKPETSGNKPMLHDIKNKIVQKRCARKREQDTRLPQSVKPPANHMAAWGARSPLR